MEKITEIESGNMLKDVFKMAWPAILESFFMALTGLVDSYMVSSLGPSPVAAIGLTTQPKLLGFSPFIAMSIAVSALVARRRGEDNRSQANRILTTGLAMGVTFAAMLSILFVGFAPQIISLCGSNADTHDSAVIYFRIIMAGIIFNGIQMTINSGQRGSGRTRISMTTNLTSCIVNITFNYLLIGGKCGFPALGIKGAAIATVFGSFVSCIMSIISLTRKSSYLSLSLIIKERLLPGMKEVRSIVDLGYSIMIEQILMRAGFMATAVMAAQQGTAAMAAHQVGMNIMVLTFSFGDGLQAATVALIGYSLGRRDPEKAKAYGRVCQNIARAIALTLAVIYFFGASMLMNMFFDEQEIVKIGVNIMRVIIFIALFQVSQTVYMGCLRGAGDTKYTAFVSTLSVTVIRTIASYVGGYVLGFGIIGIWFGVFADQFSRFLFGFLRFRKGKWVDIKI